MTNSSLQLSSSQARLPLVYFYISDESGILYKAVHTRMVIVLIDRPVGPVLSDILNPSFHTPKALHPFHGCGLTRLAGKSCQNVFENRTSRKRAEYCFESTVSEERLTEFCGKLGEFCKKLGEFALTHK